MLCNRRPGSSAPRFVRSSFFDEVLIRVIKNISSIVWNGFIPIYRTIKFYFHLCCKYGGIDLDSQSWSWLLASIWMNSLNWDLISALREFRRDDHPIKPSSSYGCGAPLGLTGELRFCAIMKSWCLFYKPSLIKWKVNLITLTWWCIIWDHNEVSTSSI